MRKRIIGLITGFVTLSSFSYAQTATQPVTSGTTTPPAPTATTQTAPAPTTQRNVTPAPEGFPDTNSIPPRTALEQTKEVSLSSFQDPGMWYTNISSDYGYAKMQLLPGKPAGSKPLPEETNSAPASNPRATSTSSTASTTLPATTESSTPPTSTTAGATTGSNVSGPATLSSKQPSVLGVRVDFIRRGVHELYIGSVRPIAIEGITKAISIWVDGRNTNHKMSVVVADRNGNESELELGTLNFLGWKNLVAAIPSKIAQTPESYDDTIGLYLKGFRIHFDLVQAKGKFYVYLDDARALVDITNQSFHDADDIIDDW